MGLLICRGFLKISKILWLTRRCIDLKCVKFCVCLREREGETERERETEEGEREEGERERVRESAETDIKCYITPAKCQP